MNCDVCGKLIGDTVYTLDFGDKYVHKCPVCHLGVEEGSKSKYQRKTRPWTKTVLEAVLRAKEEVT